MRRKKVTILLPDHSSALNLFELHHKLCHIHHHHHFDGKRIDILAIRAHYDGVFWRGFVPLLHSRYRKKVMSLLMEVFSSAIFSFEEGRGFENRCIALQQDNLVLLDEQHRHPHHHHRVLWHETTINIPSPKVTTSPSNHLIVILLPPSLISTLQPEFTFSSRLILLENSMIRLISLNAYIATLGGGYHLCRRLSTAVYLARYQRQIALQLEDLNLAGKCTVNEAYNFIHAGYIDKARLMIEFVKRDACHRKDKELISMCDAATKFAERVLHTATFRKEVFDSGTKTNDDWQRVRITRRIL